MQIILNDKTYVAGVTKARILRKAIDISDLIDFENISGKDLDILVDLVVDVYGKQFTIDELYDGLDMDKLMPTLLATLTNSINGTMDSVVAEPKNVEAVAIP